MRFAHPASVTPEQIATALDAAGWLTIADPSAETPESLAIALEDAGYHDFTDPVAETAESVALVINALPDAPVINAATTGLLTVRISWPAVPLATGYILYRDEAIDPTTERATLGDVVSVLDTGTEDTPYAYRLRATNDTGMGPYSNEQWAAPTDAAYVDFEPTNALKHERVF